MNNRIYLWLFPFYILLLHKWCWYTYIQIYCKCRNDFYLVFFTVIIIHRCHLFLMYVCLCIVCVISWSTIAAVDIQFVIFLSLLLRQQTYDGNRKKNTTSKRTKWIHSQLSFKQINIISLSINNLTHKNTYKI